MLLMENPNVERRLAKAAMYVRAHLDERLTLAEVGAVAGFSAFHFHRIFSVAFGENLNAFVVRHRMMRAARDLREDDRSIVEIALRCGYESHSAFGRAFVRAFGMSPSAYRAAAAVASRVPPRSIASFDGGVEPRVEDYPARDALAARFVGPYDAVEPTIRLALQIARRYGFFPGASILGLSYGSPDLEDHETLHFDACVTLVARANVAGAIADGLEPIAIPAGRYAVFRHRGSYDRITHAYDRLIAAWVLTGRVELREAPFVTTYLSDPAVTPDGDLECDLAIPMD